MMNYARIRAQLQDGKTFDLSHVEKIGCVEIYMLKAETVQECAAGLLKKGIEAQYTASQPKSHALPTWDVLWAWAFESGYMREDMEIPDATGVDYRSVLSHWNLADRALEGITVCQKAIPRLYKREAKEYIETEAGIVGAILAPLPHGRAVHGSHVFQPFSQELITYVGDNNRPGKIDLLNKSFEDIAEAVFDYAALCGYTNLRDQE